MAAVRPTSAPASRCTLPGGTGPVRRLDPARATGRGEGHPARARSDLQGARRCAGTGLPPGRKGERMKEVVRTETAPAPFQGAPYSQAIKANGFVFVAGQVGIRPDEPRPVGDGIREQTEQVLANIGAILEAAGSGIDRLVKTTVFLQNLADFPGINEVC